MKQYCFASKTSTGDAVALLKMAVQRTFNICRDIIPCFIDYEKTSDQTQHTEYTDKQKKVLGKKEYLCWKYKGRLKESRQVEEEKWKL